MFVPRPIAAPSRPAPLGPHARAIELVLIWIARARSRAMLGTLDDRMLRDIGIDRARADGEMSKPFWNR